MKIECTPVKTMFGKRTGSFIASFAGWHASDVDKPRAIERLQDKLQKHSDNLMVRKYIRAKGATFVLYYADGWCYDIVRDADTTHPSHCHMSCRTESEAMTNVENHVKQWNECQ